MLTTAALGMLVYGVYSIGQAVADPVLRYALSLVRTSRPKAKNAPDSVKKFVAFGASVRAAQFLVLGAKARALTNGRYHVAVTSAGSFVC